MINLDRLTDTLTFTTSGTTAVDVVHASYQGLGWCKFMKLVMPTFANTAASGNFSIRDVDGSVLWTSATVNQNTTTVISGAEIPFSGGETVRLALTAIPSGASGSINVSGTMTMYFVP